MTELANLVKQHGRIKAKFITFDNFIERNKTSKKRKELTVQIEKAQDLWEEFDAIQNRIEDIQDTKTQAAEQNDFEDNYFKLITTARELQINKRTPLILIQQQSQLPTQIKDNHGQASLRPSIKLPNIELLKFYGNYEH